MHPHTHRQNNTGDSGSLSLGMCQSERGPCHCGKLRLALAVADLCECVAKVKACNLRVHRIPCHVKLGASTCMLLAVNDSKRTAWNSVGKFLPDRHALGGQNLVRRQPAVMCPTVDDIRTADDSMKSLGNVFGMCNNFRQNKHTKRLSRN